MFGIHSVIPPLRHVAKQSLITSRLAFQTRLKSSDSAQAKDAQSALETTKGPSSTSASTSSSGGSSGPQPQKERLDRLDESDDAANPGKIRKWLLVTNKVGSYGVIPGAPLVFTP